MSTDRTRSLLDDSNQSSDYVSATGADDQSKPTTFGLSQRNRRILIGGLIVLVLVVVLAVILDFAIFTAPKPTVACTVPDFPSFDDLGANPLLPDPFVDGTGTRITSKSQWQQCSRPLISAQMQYWEFGTKQPRPAHVTSTLLPNNTGIVIYAGHDSTSTINFTVTFRLPVMGKMPYPAMMGVGGVSLNITQLSMLGVAILILPNNEIAQQNNQASRGIGKFYQLYGSNHTAGALIAWAWAASLVLDELAGSGQSVIDANSVGVTGCSRNGKGALVVGAFDERFVLTVPQESGSGGIANWRISDWQGTQTQTLGEITGENVWYTQSLSRFNYAAPKLPFDHHSLIGLVAPRGLLTIDNPDMVWLGNMSSYGGAVAGRLVYTALGAADSMGISGYGHPNHCGFVYPQYDHVDMFVRRFLLHQTGINTTLVYSDRQYPQFNLNDWVNWTVPALS